MTGPAVIHHVSELHSYLLHHNLITNTTNLSHYCRIMSSQCIYRGGVSNAHMPYTEGECPMLICPIQRGSVQCSYALYKHCISYDATFPYSRIKLTHGKCTKKVSTNKHWLKVAYFKLMWLWKCSQNWWRHCKIILLCINALDLRCPWTMQRYASNSKLFGRESRFIVLTKKRWW